MKTITIACDSCGGDLTYTRNCVDYRLSLHSENKETHPDAVGATLMTIYPPLKRACHFCGLKCLTDWIKRLEAEALSRREKIGGGE